MALPYEVQIVPQTTEPFRVVRNKDKVEIASFAHLSHADKIAEQLNKTVLADQYIQVVGYDPFLDDPNTTVERVAQTLEEWKVESKFYMGDPL